MIRKKGKDNGVGSRFRLVSVLLAAQFLNLVFFLERFSFEIEA